MNEVFARHAAVPGWDQGRLAGATVVVAGVGALGNEAARLLAMSGIGCLILCDPDTVAQSNLSRAVLFRADDVGQLKVRVAARALASLAPWARTVARAAPLASAVGLAELRAATLVLSCLDSRAARLQLVGRCQLAGVPMLNAGTHPWGGEVGFYPPDGPCYGCGLSDRERADTDDPWSCAGFVAGGEAGATAPISAVVGAWQATVAIRYCLGMALPAWTTWILPGNGTARRSPLGPPDPDCPLHQRLDDSAITKLPVTRSATAHDLLAMLGPAEDVLTWVPVTPLTGQGVLSFRLREAPPDASLATLGVAPQEILAVLCPGGRGTRYIELAPDDIDKAELPDAC